MVALVQMAIMFRWGLSAEAQVDPTWDLDHDGNVTVAESNSARAFVIAEALKPCSP